jgi:hypothetical protein
MLHAAGERHLQLAPLAEIEFDLGVEGGAILQGGGGRRSR